MAPMENQELNYWKVFKVFLVFIVEHIPAHLMIPNNRYLQIIEQGLEWQRKDCVYHEDSSF